MIIEEYVLTRWLNINKEHYISLGYEYTGYRKELLVKTTDLPENSAVKVKAICEKCNEIREIKYYKYAELCFKCSSLKNAEKGLEKIKELNKDPEYRAERSEWAKRINEFKFAKPGGRERHIERCSKMFKEFWKDDEYRKKQSEISKEVMNRPEVRAKINKSRADNFNNPEKKKEKRERGRNRRKELFEKNAIENNLSMTFDEFEKDREHRRKNIEYLEWRKNIYFRDDYTCQICLKRGSKKLQAHHLNGYHWCIEQRFNLNNGVCLCNNCHKEFHNLYGILNNMAEQFLEYTSSICFKNFSSLSEILEFNKNVKF